MAIPAPQPFDVIASRYDRDFTERTLGRWLRASVRHHLSVAFQRGDAVLDLGCGTGEDALWLAQRGMRVTATDASTKMLAVARDKANAALEQFGGVECRDGATGSLSFLRLDLASVAKNLEAGPYDGAFSNFGALNCLEDRRPLAEALWRTLRPGAKVVTVTMGPLCPWEILSFGLKRNARDAFRRFRQGSSVQLGDARASARPMGPTASNHPRRGHSQNGVRVWYPTPRKLRKEFAPWFRARRTVGIGTLLPHSQLSGLVDRWPRLFRTLKRLDPVAGAVFPGTWLNDHYLVVFERRDTPRTTRRLRARPPLSHRKMRWPAGLVRRAAARLRVEVPKGETQRLPELSPREGYARWAPSYGERQNPVQELEEDALCRLMPDLDRLQVLDVGCGKGRASGLALERGAERVVAIDASVPMLNGAGALRSASVWRLVASASRLPLATNSFDAVICALVLGHVADLDGALGETADVLRPGGILLISDFHPLGTLRGWQRTFVDVANGRTYAIRQHVHLLEDYLACFGRLGFVLEAIEEPRYEGFPLVFAMRARMM